MDFFTSKGLSVSVNAPFAGALVPLTRYRGDRRVASVTVEVNRRLYMDETTGAALPSLPRVRDILREFLALAAQAGSSRSPAPAALSSPRRALPPQTPRDPKEVQNRLKS